MNNSIEHNENLVHVSDNWFNNYQEYFDEFVYGGIDGAVTTFGVVSSAVVVGLE